MPATQQQINDLETALAAMASDIEIVLNNINESTEAITEAEEHLETMKAAHLADVLTARFELNNQLQYTNSDQRKAALIDLTANDHDYQAMKNARITLIAQNSAQKALLEKTRKLHEAKSLVLQFYANLP